MAHAPARESWFQLAKIARQDDADEDDDKALANEITAELKNCRNMLSTRRRNDLIHLRLCYGADFGGLGDSDPVTRLQMGAQTRSRWNLIAATIETATSLIAHAKPTPMYLTVEGDFSEMRRARAATKGITSLFNELGVYTQMAKLFVDANTSSIGYLHGFLDSDGRPAVERVNPFEMFINPAETSSGAEPLHMYRHRAYSRDLVKEEYDLTDEECARLPNARSADDRVALGIPSETADHMVLVTEAWRRATPGGSGRYVKACGDVVLENRRWRHKRHAFTVFRFSDRPTGFFGLGIAEMAVDTQIRVNELIRKVDRLQDLGSNAWVFVEGGESTTVKPDKLTNAPMQVVRIQGGSKPQIMTHSATPPDLARQIDLEQERLNFRLGLSESASSGERAPGVYSGAGLRATDDIQSRRLLPAMKRWEDAHMDVARMLEWLCDWAAQKNPDFSIDVEENRSGARTVKSKRWVDIRAPKGKRTKMQIFPISALPTTPQGKLAAVTDWIQNGFVSQPFALGLLEFPDTDAYTRYALAHLEYSMWIVEQVIDGEGAPEIPGYLDTKLAADVITRSLLRLRMDEAPIDIIDELEAVLEQIAEAEGAFKQVTAANAPPPGVAVDPAALAAQGVPLPQLQAGPPAVV